MHKIYFFIKIPRGGGGSTFTKNILKLKNKNYKIKVFAYEFIKNNIGKNKVTYLNNTSLTNDFPSINKIILFIKNVWKTKILLEKNTPKIIISTEIYSLILLNLINFLSRNKYLIIPRFGYDVYKYISYKPFFFFRYLLYMLVQYSFNKSKKIVFTSKELSDYLCKRFNINKSKIIHIYNMIDFTEVNELAKEKIDKEDKAIFKKNYLIIISVGRFSKQKDFLTVIKAFNIVHQKITKSSLILIGNGAQKPNLVKSVNDLKINNSVYFLGWKNNIYPYLKSSNIFVFSSFFEGFGYTILEALSQRLPIIATNTPFGPSEILEDGKYGVLVPIQNKNKMANAIISIVKNNKLRQNYINLALNRAKRFELKPILSQYNKLFESLINKNN